jgi:hypothetical protein
VLEDLRVDVRYRYGDHRLLRKELAHLNLRAQDEVIAVCRIVQSLVLTFMSRSDPEADAIGWLVLKTTHLKASDARDKVR